LHRQSSKTASALLIFHHLFQAKSPPPLNIISFVPAPAHHALCSPAFMRVSCHQQSFNTLLSILDVKPGSASIHHHSSACCFPHSNQVDKGPILIDFNSLYNKRMVWARSNGLMEDVVVAAASIGSKNGNGSVRVRQCKAAMLCSWCILVIVVCV
jgi:hypothetical protein